MQEYAYDLPRYIWQLEYLDAVEAEWHTVDWFRSESNCLLHYKVDRVPCPHLVTMYEFNLGIRIYEVVDQYSDRVLEAWDSLNEG